MSGHSSTRGRRFTCAPLWATDELSGLALRLSAFHSIPGAHRLGLLALQRTPVDALAGPVRRAGDHPHDLAGSGAAGRREPGHLPAGHHAVGARRQGGERLLVLPRFLRLRAVRGRHRSVLGAISGA